MNLKEKFNKFIHEQTTDAFHDAILLKIIINFNEKKIIIEIEHWKDKNTNIGKEGYYICNIAFLNISNIFLSNTINSIAKEDEVDEFNISIIDDKYCFKLVGIQGWIFSFLATEFKYTEKYKGLSI